MLKELKKIVQMGKVLLLGWDAADWQIIWPLINKGKMPAFKKLITNGVYANMSTMDPPFSPMLWTSVATGKTPDKHGILNFIEVNQDNEIQPVSVKSRKTRAIWNILTHKNKKSNVVGWWPTHPPEPINGVMVSDKFQKGYNANNFLKNWASNPATVHPPEYYNALEKYRFHPTEITQAHLLPFMPKAAQIDQKKDKSLLSFANVFAQNTTIHATATKVMRETEWDFMAVYYDMVDHFCHGFMKYHPPKLKPIPKEKFEIYNEVINGAYIYQDMMLDRMMQLVDKDTTIIVMSDHGYESGSLRILEMPKFSAAPAMEHRQFGMFAAMGPGIKKNTKIFGLGLLDIAPTLLHHFNLPVGKDMDGKVIQDMYENPKPVKFIDSWDAVEGNFGEHTGEVSTTIENQEQLQQLIDLGYVDALDKDKGKALRQVKCDVKHNLARVHKGKKDYERAKELLLQLVTEEVDTVPFYLDLLTISLSQDEYDEAETYLLKLRTLEHKFKFSTTVSEAKIAIGQGKINKGIKLLEEAKEKKPTPAIWYELGKQYLRLEKYEMARDSFMEAMETEVDNARFQQALAVTYNRLGDYEAAAEHAFVAIELIKYFPEAHYTLGEALQNLGETEMAKNAFENAARLTPRKHHRAEHALINLNEQLSASDKKTEVFDEKQILIVSGLPRSGTSLMMQMLHSAGIEALVDGKREADISNPKGYFEYEPVKGLQKNNDWLHLAKGKSVKIVAPLLKFLDPQYRYKVIFMRRNLNEIVTSQQIMIGKDANTLPVALLESYKKTVLSVDNWHRKEPGVEFLYVDYKEVIKNPAEAISKVVEFVNPKLDIEAMKGCVDTKLYRNVKS
jgi:predicted AlkP superfamily phosphohydrolase/phosphomutase/tetratricopeptide (TPR) repeat protein